MPSEAAADEGPCVFVGRCADYVLRDYDNRVDVFITANLADRIARVCSRLGCDEETARKKIASGENERSTYYNYYTGKEWGHSASYDLCVNSSLLGLEAHGGVHRGVCEQAVGAVKCR